MYVVGTRNDLYAKYRKVRAKHAALSRGRAVFFVVSNRAWSVGGRGINEKIRLDLVIHTRIRNRANMRERIRQDIVHYY